MLGWARLILKVGGALNASSFGIVSFLCYFRSIETGRFSWFCSIFLSMDLARLLLTWVRVLLIIAIKPLAIVSSCLYPFGLAFYWGLGMWVIWGGLFRSPSKFLSFYFNISLPIYLTSACWDRLGSSTITFLGSSYSDLSNSLPALFASYGGSYLYPWWVFFGDCFFGANSYFLKARSMYIGLTASS